MYRARLHEAARQAAAFVFPNRCPFCGELCGVRDFWHEQCFGALPFVTECIVPPQGLSSLSAVCYYERKARSAVLRYKAGSFVYSAEAFAVLMTEAVGEDAKRADCIVPVPSSLKSVLERGYSPADKIARLISLRCAVPVRHPLGSPFDKGEQKLLSAEERRENALKAYFLKGKPHLSGQRILLVDDVCTTGSTLSACAKLLKTAGASEVFGAVFAKTRRI